MRVLVTGRTGQLARSLVDRGPRRDFEIVTIGRPAIDLAATGDLTGAVAQITPDAVVNAAAYTAVDGAENEPDMAQAVNGRGAGLVARAAARLGIPIVQISTDYVFDGAAKRPYREDDATAPLNAYGRSKLAGENAVAAENPDYAILRTGWVYSPFGKNFVRTMLDLARRCDEVAVVADKRGTPNSALDLADGIALVARNLVERRDARALRGIFHLSSGGEANWAEFATQIFEISSRLGGPTARVRPITTDDYPTLAKRPAYSRLDATKLAVQHKVHMPDWRISLEESIRRILTDESGDR